MIMKKFSFGSFVFLLLSFQSLQAQIHVKLFSEYIPKIYLEDEDKVEQIEVNLNQYAMTDPDLIYYYLNYLELIEEKKIFNRDSNYFNILQYESSLSNTLNNKWVDEEMSKLVSLTEPGLIMDELESLLDNFRVSETNPPKATIELFVDLNLQKFFAYKSLTGEQSLTFNEKSDYQKLFSDKIQELIFRMKSDYESHLSGDDSTRKIDLEYLYQHHIFSRGYSEGQIDSAEFNFLEYLLSFIDYSLFQENSGILAGFHTETILQEFPGSTFIEPYLPYSEITIPSTDSEIAFYNLTLGYRIKLREFKSPFSHLDVGVGYSFKSTILFSDTSSINLDNFYFIWEGEPGNFSLLFFGTVQSATWVLDNFSEFSLSITTPVYYLSQNLFFDLGIQYKYITTEYSVVVHREINDQIAEDPSMLGPEDEKINFNSENNLFGGSIAVHYSPINNFTLICSISTFKAVQLGFNYLFTL